MGGDEGPSSTEQIINDGTTAGDIDACVKKNADPGGSKRTLEPR